MTAITVRRLATVWWVRNLNRGNPARAARWKALANRNGGSL